jgi:divalent metal cation (Fe/Co/Zn/Cd) transporter
MVESPIVRTVDTELAIRRLQWFTIIWMAVEVAVSFMAAMRSHSVALTAFGGDSAIELTSATVILTRFRSPRRITEQFASKITGWLLVALAVYIAAHSLYTLIAVESKPEPSHLGIGLLFAAALVMPWLGRRKRQLAIATKSSALQADAAQSSLCAYLSWIALAGLLLNALAHTAWADPIAALGLLPFVINEAKEAFEERTCSCDCSKNWRERRDSNPRPPA